MFNVFRSDLVQISDTPTLPVRLIGPIYDNMARSKK